MIEYCTQNGLDLKICIQIDFFELSSPELNILIQNLHPTGDGGAVVKTSDWQTTVTGFDPGWNCPDDR